MSQDIKSILMNREMIAVDQDSMGVQGVRVWLDTANTTFNIGKQVLTGADLQVYVKPMRDSSRAVVLFNKGAASASLMVTWRQLGWPDTTHAQVRDLWAHADAGGRTQSYSATVASHDVVALRITPDRIPTFAANAESRRCDPLSTARPRLRFGLADDAQTRVWLQAPADAYDLRGRALVRSRAGVGSGTRAGATAGR
jgi:hypothetical protein